MNRRIPYGQRAGTIREEFKRHGVRSLYDIRQALPVGEDPVAIRLSVIKMHERGELERIGRGVYRYIGKQTRTLHKPPPWLDEALNAYTNGVTVSEIARMVGRSRQVVAYWLKK